MHVMIIGAAGMIGRKLAAAIAKDGLPGGTPVTALTLADVITPETPTGLAVPAHLVSLDLSQQGAADRLVEARPDIIIHLAAIVSGATPTMPMDTPRASSLPRLWRCLAPPSPIGFPTRSTLLH